MIGGGEEPKWKTSGAYSCRLLTAGQVPLGLPEATVRVVDADSPVAGDGAGTKLGRDADGEVSGEGSISRSREVHVVLFRAKGWMRVEGNERAGKESEDAGREKITHIISFESGWITDSRSSRESALLLDSGFGK